MISTQDRNDASKLPGLGDLPVAGRLFSSQRDDNQRTELVLSITPRIIRNVRRPDANEAELWIGTEALQRMRPVGGVAPPAEAADGAAAGTPSGGSPGTSPGASPGAPLPAASPRPAGAPPQDLAAAGVPRIEGPAGPTVQWVGPAEAKAGATFTVTLGLQTDQPLRGVPLHIGYTKDKLELLGAEEGDLFKQGGAQTSFTRMIDAATGQARVGVLRNQATGASGQGSVVTLRFKALAAGAAEVRILALEPVGLAGPVIKPAAWPAYRVQVQ